jgi:hypothetical protein
MNIRKEIREHMKLKGSITRLEALGLYGCMDVTTVIRDLKRGNKSAAPMKIKTDIRFDANGKRYARYFVRGTAK